MKRDKISFVIPCYGSEKTISKLISDIVSTVADKNQYEIVCINDGSFDNVYSILERLSESNQNIKVINLSKNFGQHNAIMAGFHYITGDIVVCLDDDNQIDPKDCYKLIEALGNDADIVWGKYPVKKENIFRLIGSFAAKKMSQWLCSVPKDVYLSSYFCCKRFVVKEVIRYENTYPYLPGLLFRVTKTVKNVNVSHYERKLGKSGYSIRKLISLWLNGFTAFSIKPLRLASFLGFFTAIAGFIYSIIIMLRKVMNPEILMGYSSIMCALLFIGGMLMLMIGLVGEYIGRIYICLNKSPQYVIRNTINIDEK